jgi:STE24 endopeptidase
MKARMKKIHYLLDVEKQEQARRYEKEKRVLGLAGTFLSLVLLLSFYYSGASLRAADLFPGRPVVLAFLIYTAAFLGAFTLLMLPLDFYSGYVHEHTWKFSNQTVKSWLAEKGKSFLVSLVILNLLLGPLLWIMTRFARTWWLIAGIAMAIVSVIFATLFPVVILPIFNKYRPIENEELTRALEETLARGGLRSSGFFEEDMSRQTKKENAFLAGLGKTRRVVLGDNLMKNMTIPEIESVIAHEVGHFRHRHIWKGVLAGTVQQLVVFYALNLVMRALFPGFLASPRLDLGLFPMFFVLAGVISGFLFGPLGKALSRHFEKQADQYALESIKDKKAFLTAMAGLANRNLANAYPEEWVKLLFYTHPPIGERLAMGEAALRPAQENQSLGSTAL